MKKILNGLFIGILCLITASCSGASTEVNVVSASQQSWETKVDSQTSTVENSSQPSRIIETATVSPTAETVHQAYLAYLQDHPAWFVTYERSYAYAMDKQPFAFWDMNGDGVEEMLHFRPYDEERTLKLNLCIVTYEDGGVKTLYDGYATTLAGSEAGFSVMLGADDKLYSLHAKECNGHVIRFDYEGSAFSAVTLAESTAAHLAEPEDADSYLNGEKVPYEEFSTYRKSVEDGVKKYLLMNHSNQRGVEDISMSYADTVAYLT